MQSHDSTSQKVLLPAFNLLKMYLNEISLESSDIIFCRKQVEGGFWYTSRRPVYRLTQDFIQRLNRTVINNTDLQVFCFNDFDDLSVEVEWTPEQTCAVGHALKNHPTLEKIDIEISREAKPNVIVNFLQCLTGSAPIKTLHLKLHENVDESFLNEIGKIFLKNTSLKEIRIALSDIHQDIFKNSLAEFFEGLVHIPSLKELCLKNFSAADDNLKILHKMHSLKKLTLDSMNCTDESMVILSDILKVNLNIEFLDLSANPLDALGIKILADTLPFLPFLKYLRLDNIILPMQNSEGFDYLAAIFKQHGLKVEYLHIEQRVDNRFYSAQGLQDLISDNRYLKKLYVGDLLEEDLAACIPLLANVQKCHLKHFDFFGQFSSNTYRAMIQVMQFNRNLRLYPPYSNQPIELAIGDARAQNSRLAKANYIHESVALAHGYYSKPVSKKTGLANLPLDVLYLIFAMTWDPHEVYLEPVVLKFHHQLHLQNFAIRRHLLDEKKYHPKIQKNIHQWWFREIKPREEIHQILQKSEQKNTSILQQTSRFFNTIANSVANRFSFRKLR